MTTNDAARELALYTVNDETLYRQQAQPIIANLRRKIAKGTYDAEKAPKLWYYLAVSGAKAYATEFATPGTVGAAWHKMFSAADRKTAAVEIAEHYADELT